MTTISPMHNNQGIKAMESGSQIGGTTIVTGSGSPAGVVVANTIGDLYIDQANGVLYQATATGMANWSALATLAAIPSGTTIGGTGFNTGSGTPKNVVTPVRIDDLYFDYTNGVLWMANGTTNTSWVVVATSTPDIQTYTGNITLAQIQAGVVLVPGITGYTITPIRYKIIVKGTPGGTGNLVLEDTNTTPVVITTVAEASLAGILTSEVTATGKTDGAGMCAPLTTGKGIQIPATATLTTLTGIYVVIDYQLN
jgi:hypothetical protein